MTATRLSTDVAYQWGHMGMCNCGHLARSITGLTGREIHEWALEREGDWEQHARDYCPTSGLLIDHVIAAMFEIGMTRDDIRHLEKLSDPDVVLKVGRYLQRNQRQDVILYMRAWADLLESVIPSPHVAPSALLRAGCARDRGGGVTARPDPSRRSG